MESILNLLLLRGKFLTTKAAETLHEAIRRCLQYQRKITVEYNTATQMIHPFDNMLEAVNYQTCQYKSEEENDFTTNESYDLYDFLSKSSIAESKDLSQFVANPPPNEELIMRLDKTSRLLHNLSKSQHAEAVYQILENQEEEEVEKRTIDEEKIVDNLYAILKSQEFLFKNIAKLVSILEKNEVLKKSKKLEKIKNKVSACTDILSNTAPNKQFSNIINQLIEEEITRCRFRNGETKTSAEISLKVPKPIGLEAVLDTDVSCASKKKSPHQKVRIKKDEKTTVNLGNLRNRKTRKNQIELEVKSNLHGFLRRSESDPIIREKLKIKDKNDIDHNLKKNLKKNQITAEKPKNKPKNDFFDPNKKITKSASQTEQKISLQTNKPPKADIEELRKMIKINEEQFKKFENSLWHTSTTMKFLSLKDEYKNMVKCAFYNKRQFIATEMKISKQNTKRTEEETMRKFVDTSNTMFQVMERKLLFEQVKKELIESGQLPASEESFMGDFLKQQKEAKKLPPKTYSEVVLPHKEVPAINEKSHDGPKIKMLPKLIKALNTIENLKEASNLPILRQQALVVMPESNQKLLITNLLASPKNTKLECKNQKTSSVINNIKLEKDLPNKSVLPKKEIKEEEKKDVQKTITSDKSTLKSLDEKIIISPPMPTIETGTLSNKKELALSFMVKQSTVDSQKNAFQPALLNRNVQPEYLSKQFDSKSSTDRKTELKFSTGKIENEIKTVQNKSDNGETVIEKTKLKSTTADVKLKLEEPSASATHKEIKTLFEKKELLENPNLKLEQSRIEKVPFQYPTEKIQPAPVAVKIEPKKVDTFPAPKSEEKLEPQVSNKNEKFIIDELGRKNIEQKTFSYFNYESGNVPKTNWRQIVNKITPLKIKVSLKKSDKEESKIEAKTDNISDMLKADEKKAMNDILQKYTRAATGSYVKPEAPKLLKKDVEQKNLDVQKLSDEEERKHLIKESPGKSSLVENVQTETKIEAESVDKKEELVRNKSVSMTDLSEEAQRIKMNEKAFSELETTIKNVKIFVEKGLGKKCLKTTTQSKTRKIDEPVKKSMSTSQVHQAPRKIDLAKNVSYRVNFQAPIKHIQDRQRMFQQIKKQANKLSVPANKTFLKKVPKLSEKKISPKAIKKSENVISTESKPDIQMRRTTKNAMRRQQVMTILPKLAKLSVEKKKSISLLETDEIKLRKQTSNSRKKSVGIRKTISVGKIIPGKILIKKSSEQIKCIEWKMQDEAEIVHILES